MSQMDWRQALLRWRIQFRRGTTDAWTSANTVLLLGEPGWDQDLLRLKIGDGETPWNELAWASLDPGSLEEILELLENLPDLDDARMSTVIADVSSTFYGLLSDYVQSVVGDYVLSADLDGAVTGLIDDTTSDAYEAVEGLVEDGERASIAGRVASERKQVVAFNPTVTQVMVVDASTDTDRWNANPSYAYFEGVDHLFYDSNTFGTEGHAGQKVSARTSTDGGLTWSARTYPFHDAAQCDNPLSDTTVEWQPNLLVRKAADGTAVDTWCSFRGAPGYVAIKDIGALWHINQIEFKGLLMRISDTITPTPAGGWSRTASFDGQTDWLPFPGQMIQLRDGTVALPMTLVSNALDPAAPPTAPTFYKQLKWNVVAYSSDDGATWTLSDPVQPPYGAAPSTAWEPVLFESAFGDIYLGSRDLSTSMVNNHAFEMAVSRNRYTFTPSTFVDLLVPSARMTAVQVSPNRWIAAQCDHPNNDSSSPEAGSSVGRRNGSLFVSTHGTDDLAPGFGWSGDSLNQQYPWLHVNNGKIHIAYAEDLPAGGRSMRLAIIDDVPDDDSVAYAYARRYAEIVGSTAPERITGPPAALLFSGAQQATAAAALSASADISFAAVISPSSTASQILTDFRPNSGTSAPPSLFTDGVRFGSLLLAHNVTPPVNAGFIIGASLDAAAGALRFNVFTASGLTQSTAYLKSMTVSGTPVDGDQVTVDGTTLTWKTTPTTGLHIAIGVGTLANAINLSAALVTNGKKSAAYGSTSKVLVARSDQATFSISYPVGTAVATDSAIPITGAVAPRFGYKIPTTSSSVGFGGVLYDAPVWNAQSTDANMMYLYAQWRVALGLPALSAGTAPGAASIRLTGTSTSTDFPDIDLVAGTVEIDGSDLVITGEASANVEQPYTISTDAITFQLAAAPTGVERYTIATLGGPSNPLLVQLHGETGGAVWLGSAPTGIIFSDTTRENSLEVTVTEGRAEIGIIKARVPGPVRVDLGGPNPLGKEIRFNLDRCSVGDGRVSVQGKVAYVDQQSVVSGQWAFTSPSATTFDTTPKRLGFDLLASDDFTFPVWPASTAVKANRLYRLPTGGLGFCAAGRTTRSTFDATERDLWTFLPGGHTETGASWKAPLGITQIAILDMAGAGAGGTGGGSSATATKQVGGPGGACGERCMYRKITVVVGTTYAGTLGTGGPGGAGGAAGGNPGVLGTAGGDTSVTIEGTLYKAGGGNVGVAPAANSTASTLGGPAGGVSWGVGNIPGAGGQATSGAGNPPFPLGSLIGGAGGGPALDTTSKGGLGGGARTTPGSKPGAVVGGGSADSNGGNGTAATQPGCGGGGGGGGNANTGKGGNGGAGADGFIVWMF